jgi:hypothetical protein
MSRWEPEERLESLLRTLTLVVRKKSVRSVSSSRVSDFRSCDPGRSCAIQQLREALPGDAPFHFLIHDRNRIFSLELDKAVAAMGVRVFADAAPSAPSKCPMRTCGRNHTPRVPGFPHPAGTAASQTPSQPLGRTLQPWPSSYEPGTRDTIPAHSVPALLRASTSAPAGSSSVSQSRAGWTAP